ncbi:MAG: hypothetical protein E7035_05110 [Verrucomicrobiaceae bacterium]|nr:hypothetical protein [Verrucomicrobiaceae bacterium]
MKKTITNMIRWGAVLLAVLVPVVVNAIESATINVVLKDNRVVSNVVNATRIADNTTQIKILAKDIPANCKYIEIFADNAVAEKGQDGFWIMNRGLMGYFNKDNGKFSASKKYMYLPYYAMKSPQENFIAVIDGMRFEFNVNVEVVDGVYKMYPRWYISDIGFAPYEDIVITYYTLPKDADYNEMAKIYRKHRFAQNPKIKPIKERFKTQPLLEQVAKSFPVRMDFARKHFNRKKDNANFYQRGTKPWVDEKNGIKADREERAPISRHYSSGIAMMHKMKAIGLDDIFICASGFQDGGYDGRCPTTFPICKESGGEEEFKKYLAEGKKLGYVIDGHSNYTDAFTCSPDWSPDNISKSPDGKLELNGAWSGGKAYNLCLANAYEKYIKRDLPKLATLGLRGAHYIDVFTAVYPYRCCDPNHAGNRKQMAEIQDKIAQLCRDLFGGFASECGFDHIIDKVDYINYVTAPMRAKYVYKSKGMQFVDKFVPFWELVYHDIVLHNTDKVTQGTLNQDNNLILVEFGGRPIYYGVNDNNLPHIKKAYDQYMKLRHLMLEEMLSHKEVAKYIFVVSYANGEKVVVNKTKSSYTYNGVEIPAKDFRLISAKK